MNRRSKTLFWVLSPVVFIASCFGFLNLSQEYMICARPIPQSLAIDGERHTLFTTNGSGCTFLNGIYGHQDIKVDFGQEGIVNVRVYPRLPDDPSGSLRITPTGVTSSGGLLYEMR